MISNPADVLAELQHIRNQTETGIALLAEKEAEWVTLDLEAQKVEALAFLNAEGTVADRQALAKLQSIEARGRADLAKVEVGRIKTKLKHLSETQMAIQTSARMVELGWKLS